MLSKDDFFNASLKSKIVTTSIGPVAIRELTAIEYQRYAILFMDEDGKLNPLNTEDMNVTLCLFCCVDGANNQLFDEGDIPRLRKMPASIISQLAHEIRDLSGISSDDDDNAKKNLNGTTENVLSTV